MARRRWPKGSFMRLRSSETLRALIRQRGLSYAGVGGYAKCHKSFIGALVVGTKTSCKAETAELIAEVLGVPLDLLFDPTTSTASARVIPTQKTNGASVA